MGGAMALKHWFVTLLLALVAAVAARAQGGGEQDFASRFMSLYGKGRAVECTTVSPLMLERMMQLPDVEGDSHTREVLKQLKSIRLVSSTAGHDVTHLYANARRLAERLTCELYERMLQLYACTPQERYETLLRRCPELLNIVALKELASYLRVRPETLSRIRGRVR